MERVYDRSVEVWDFETVPRRAELGVVNDPFKKPGAPPKGTPNGVLWPPLGRAPALLQGFVSRPRFLRLASRSPIFKDKERVASAPSRRAGEDEGCHRSTARSSTTLSVRRELERLSRRSSPRRVMTKRMLDSGSSRLVLVVMTRRSVGPTGGLRERGRVRPRVLMPSLIRISVILMLIAMTMRRPPRSSVSR